jgi:CubicO group peptidase (beta-lactamase class C family)
MFVRVAILIFLLTHFGEANGNESAKGCAPPGDDRPNMTAIESNLLPKVRFLGEPESGSPVSERIDFLKVPAISFALIKGGRVKWTSAYGTRIAGEDDPVTCETLFQAASLSKPLTLIAAVRMQDAGLIDLDVDIQNYLRDYTLPTGEQSAANPITFRNLLEHTSGLTPGGFLGYHRDLALPTDIDILNGTGVANSPRLESLKQPGAELAYSGGGYTVVEVAMQDVAGKPFDDLMSEWILGPLNMQSSEFTQPLPASRAKEVAQGHDGKGKTIDGGWNNYPEQAAAGLWSTAGDLAKFIVEIFKAYHRQSDEIDKDAIHNLLHDQRDGHAYGFIVSGNEGEAPTITHYGGNIGYRSFMFINLQTGDGAVYLTSSDAGGNLGSEFLYSASRVYGWQSYQQEEAVRAFRSEAALKRLVGEYAFNENLKVTIDYSDSEKAIGVNFPNGDRYYLVPIAGDSQFIHANTGVTVSFAIDADTQSLTLYGDTAKRVD